MAGFSGNQTRKFGGFNKQAEAPKKQEEPKAERKQSVGLAYIRTSKKGEQYLALMIDGKKYVGFFAKEKKQETHPDISIYPDEGKGK